MRNYKVEKFGKYNYPRTNEETKMVSVLKFCASYWNRSLQGNVHLSAFSLLQRRTSSRSVDGLPEKPKRPPSAWLLFLTERRKELREQLEFEDIPLMQMSKKVSKEWRNFDDIDKIPYREKYEESLAEYREKMKDYKSSLTRADKRLLRNIKMDEKHEVKEFEKEFPKPKYPGNGYILFVKSNLEENPRHNDQDMKDWIRDCASKWQNLDENQKQTFNDRALPLMKKYRQELKEWKEKYQVVLLTLSSSPFCLSLFLFPLHHSNLPLHVMFPTFPSFFLSILCTLLLSFPLTFSFSIFNSCTCIQGRGRQGLPQGL